MGLLTVEGVRRRDPLLLRDLLRRERAASAERHRRGDRGDRRRDGPPRRRVHLGEPLLLGLLLIREAVARLEDALLEVSVL